ncbi:MAG TPA: amino acid permease [Spirochaetota bacterium]|nr:amino acid permease [Spirochaetota bacterium]
MELKRQLGLPTAILVVVASMIGTGIFITTGEILGMTHNALMILVLWGIALLVAVTGSLCYAELATMWPHVGGEYVYLKKTFGMLPAFLTGWISLIIGFTACVAITSITVMEYLHQFFRSVDGNSSITLFLASPWNQKIMASLLIIFFGGVHIMGVRTGSAVQNVLTVLKVLIITSIVGFGFYMVDWSQAGRLVEVYPESSRHTLGGVPVMGLSLLIIMFSYAGWNGASYLAGEIKNPEKNLPRALLLGTVATSVLYLLVNIVFLMSAPGPELMNQKAIGAVAARSLFGPGVSSFFTLAIALILLSSISVEIMIGPRVYYAMAKDRMLFSILGTVSERFRTPAFAIMLQVLLSVFYVFIGNSTMLMEYMGFALSLFPVLTVVGLIHMRRAHPEIPRPFRVPLYPLVPIVFIAFSVFMLVAGFMAWTATSRFAILAVLAGVPVFYAWRWYTARGRASALSQEPSAVPETE